MTKLHLFKTPFHDSWDYIGAFDSIEAIDARVSHLEEWRDDDWRYDDYIAFYVGVDGALEEFAQYGTELDHLKIRHYSPMRALVT